MGGYCEVVARGDGCRAGQGGGLSWSGNSFWEGQFGWEKQGLGVSLGGAELAGWRQCRTGRGRAGVGSTVCHSA